MAVTANNRIFYACQVVGFKGMGDNSTSYRVAHGVQSVGITTNFNLEQAFELGQIQIYENQGAINLTIGYEQTENLAPSVAVYDLEVTSPEGVRTKLLKGRCRIEGEVTR